MFLNLYSAVGRVISCCLPGFLMRVLVFLLLGTNQQLITLHKACLAKQAALGAARLWNGVLGESQVSRAQAGHTLPCWAWGGRRGIE